MKRLFRTSKSTVDPLPPPPTPPHSHSNNINHNNDYPHQQYGAAQQQGAQLPLQPPPPPPPSSAQAQAQSQLQSQSQSQAAYAHSPYDPHGSYPQQQQQQSTSPQSFPIQSQHPSAGGNGNGAVGWNGARNGENGHGHAQGVKKSSSGMKLDAFHIHQRGSEHGHGHGHGQEGVNAGGVGGGGGEQASRGKGWFGNTNSSSVTPFPLDIGQVVAPARRLSRREKKDRGVPNLAEMQARSGHIQGQAQAQAQSQAQGQAKVDKERERDRDRDRERERRDRDRDQMPPPPRDLPMPMPNAEGNRSRGNSGASPVVGSATHGSNLPPLNTHTRPMSSSRFYETELASPDSSWTVVPSLPPKQTSTGTGGTPGTASHRDSPEPIGSRHPSPPLPIPSAPAMQGQHTGHSSGRSSPTSQGLYLPPGARPPTPPASLRPGTPTRPGFAPSSLGHSQTSVLSQSLGGGPFDPEVREWERDREPGRDRGYSSASGSHRGSDVESSASHTAHGQSAKLSKPPSHGHGHGHASGKSPLAQNTFPADSPSPGIQGGTSFPTPQPHPYALGPGATSPYSPMSEEGASMPMPMNSTAAVPPPHERPYEDHHGDMHAMSGGQHQQHQQHAGKEKEKKRFWGMDMGWTGKKDKEREKDKDKEKEKDKSQGFTSPMPPMGGFDAQRRGSEWSDRSQQQQLQQQQQQQAYGAQNQMVTQNYQQYSHGGSQMMMEEEQRGRMAGRLPAAAETQDPAHAKDVSSAIQMLCSNPDPSFSAVYAVCERISVTDGSDTIAKEAARALRKQFKHGNEAERRAAAVVWLLMMRNIKPHTGFRGAATSKKFLANVEPILLAPPTKPLVNQNTYRIIADIVGDLTFHYSHERGCEGLVELWKKIKLRSDDDGGRPLPVDHPIFQPEAQYPNFDALRFHPGQQYDYSHSDHGGANGYDARPQSIVQDQAGGRKRRSSRDRAGPGYAALPSHKDDMRRLLEESTAAKESARVLAEALVFTRPDELEDKPIIKEFYNKCFHAHESLTGQMEWAQAEAARSRERSHGSGVLTLEPQPEVDRTQGTTIEEEALAALFEAHASLSEAVKQHDDLERMAMEHRELSEVRERSKKETRMGRDDPARLEALSSSYGNEGKRTGFLSAEPQASTSRSPSPAPRARLGASPRDDSLPLPQPMHAEGYRSNPGSRTPSPDALPHPPKMRASPNHAPRAASPLGNRVRGSRPLPTPGSNNPFRSQHASNASLNSSAGTHGQYHAQSNNPFGGGAGGAGAQVQQPNGFAVSNPDGDDEGADDEAPRTKPSRKALGKRRAAPVDPDNDFDPNDMFAGNTNNNRKDDTSSSSEESLTADDIFFAKPPVTYVYDAYKEKLDKEAEAASSGTGTGAGSGSGGGGSASASVSVPANPPGSATASGTGAASVGGSSAALVQG